MLLRSRMSFAFRPLSHICQVLIILTEYLITVLNMNFKIQCMYNLSRVKLPETLNLAFSSLIISTNVELCDFSSIYKQRHVSSHSWNFKKSIYLFLFTFYPLNAGIQHRVQTIYIFSLYQFLINFYWSIVALQCWKVSAQQQSESAIHVHISHLLQTYFFLSEW